MNAGVNRDLVVGGVVATLLHAAALVALGAPPSRDRADIEPAWSTVVVMTSVFDARPMPIAEPNLEPVDVAPPPPRVDPLPPAVDPLPIERQDTAPIETLVTAPFTTPLVTNEPAADARMVEPRVDLPLPTTATSLPTMETRVEPETAPAQTIITETVTATGGPAMSPRVTNYRAPVYPETARRRGYEGTTVLRIHVLADGRVAAIEIATSSGYTTLDRSAHHAAGRWRFEPATRDGRAIDRWVEIPVHFNIES